MKLFLSYTDSRVVAMKSTGVATSEPFNLSKNCEDTITLLVQWLNLKTGNLGTNKSSINY